MTRNRPRPANPLTVARRRAAERQADRDPQTWGVDPASLLLPANADVVSEDDTDERRGSVRRRPGRRRDIFDRILAHERREALAAVRRLQADLALLHGGPTGVARYQERIDGCADSDPWPDRRLRAGERVRSALALTGAVSGRLLLAICEADVGPAAGGDWRALVRRETGEHLADAQAGALRLACGNLALAYAALDRTRRG
jgi:hypothetical protein